MGRRSRERMLGVSAGERVVNARHRPPIDVPDPVIDDERMRKQIMFDALKAFDAQRGVGVKVIHRDLPEDVSI